MPDVICTRVIIPIAGYDADYAFYRDVMAFPLFREYANPRGRGAAFGDAVWGVEIIEKADAQPLGPTSIAIEIRDAATYREAIASRGGDVSALRAEGWATLFSVSAPSGFRLDFFQRAG
jgi:predicted enzyme related to lactoylglutathione lyase